MQSIRDLSPDLFSRVSERFSEDFGRSDRRLPETSESLVFEMGGYWGCKRGSADIKGAWRDSRITESEEGKVFE